MKTVTEQRSAPEIEITTCPECGGELLGKYCHRCGEKRPDAEDLRLKHFFHHALDEVTHFDSKIFRTLRALVLRPGFLTAEYFAGRKQRYVLPLRLFLVIFALNLFLYTRPGVAIYDMRFILKSDPQGLLKQKLEHAAEKRHVTSDTLYDQINARWEKDVSFFQFGDVFFFAGVVALVFFRRRYFGEHLIFSLHVLSFSFLFSMLFWLYYAFSGMRITFFLPVLSSVVLFLYLWKATSRVYGAKGSEALLKSILLVIGLDITRIFFIFFTFILAIIQTLR